MSFCATGVPTFGTLRAMTDPAPPSAFDVLESEVKRSLRARALELERRLGPLEGAVLAYRRALEAEVARDYAAAHSLRFERPAGKTRHAAATALHELVTALPELAPHAAEPELLPAEPDEPADRLSPARLDPARLDPARLDPARKAIADVLPHIAAELTERTLVILGSLAVASESSPKPWQPALSGSTPARAEPTRSATCPRACARVAYSAS